MSALRFIFILALLAGPAFLPAEGGKPAAAVGAPQNRCFCLQYTPGGFSPYYLGRLTPPAPECAGVKYEANGKSPQENGLLTCDQLRDCLKAAAPFEEKKKILAAKTAQAKERLAACRAAPGEGAKLAEPGAGKCVSDWEGILKVLSAETEKQGREEQEALRLCAAKPQKTKARRGKTAGN